MTCIKPPVERRYTQRIPKAETTPVATSVGQTTRRFLVQRKPRETKHLSMGLRPPASVGCVEVRSDRCSVRQCLRVTSADCTGLGRGNDNYLSHLSIGVLLVGVYTFRGNSSFSGYDVFFTHENNLIKINN